MTIKTIQPVDLTGFSSSSVTKLLINRLEYWFRGKKKKHFFKFLCPCEHILYREGDSWTEELGISRKTFLRHFDRIGTRWPSKSAFGAANNPFLGKPYACYYDRKENITRYFKNPNFIQSHFSGKLFINAATKCEKETVKTQADQKIEQRQSFKQTPKNDYIYGKSRPVKMASPLYTHNTPDKSKDLSFNVQIETLSLEEEEIAKEIQEVWKKEVGGRTYTSKTFLKKLYVAFKTLFKGSLEVWKNYCRKIASSRFLMGEISHFRAWISWAIREETYEKLEAGEYTLGDRISKTAEKEKAIKIKNDIDNSISKKIGEDRTFHEMLRERVGESTYAVWFKNISVSFPKNSECAVEICVSSSFTASYINQHFLSILEEITCHLLGVSRSCSVVII